MGAFLNITSYTPCKSAVFTTNDIPKIDRAISHITNISETSEAQSQAKNSADLQLVELNRLKAGKPDVVTGEYEINLDTIAADCGLKRGSIRRDRLSDDFKATLDESVAAREETLSQEPKSKLKMANEECRKLREK
ncbi:hypothetical protein CMK12_17040 [Candidatus Poribacteria bacterium]|nr:hypothetical protein [Candidatus Poribacteria bacterium]